MCGTQLSGPDPDVEPKSKLPNTTQLVSSSLGFDTLKSHAHYVCTVNTVEIWIRAGSFQ